MSVTGLFSTKYHNIGLQNVNAIMSANLNINILDLVHLSTHSGFLRWRQLYSTAEHKIYEWEWK